jgi:hypothetical protein
MSDLPYPFAGETTTKAKVTRLKRELADACDDSEPRISIITDEKLLRQWNHDEPCLQIATAERAIFIPLSRVTGRRIEVALDEFEVT